MLEALAVATADRRRLLARWLAAAHPSIPLLYRALNRCKWLSHATPYLF